MIIFKILPVLLSVLLFCSVSYAHYPYVAPLAYQTFNNQTAVIAGFYDNPFVSEIQIKSFQFTQVNPTGEQIELANEAWIPAKILSNYSLKNIQDGTYKIRGVRYGNKAQFAQVDHEWKTVLKAENGIKRAISEHIVYADQLSSQQLEKTVQTVDIIETFISRRLVSNEVLKSLDQGFEIEFLTHPNDVRG